MPSPYPVNENDLSNSSNALINALSGVFPSCVPYPVDEADLSNATKALINAIASGGGGGTDDYDGLKNKPAVDGIELSKDSTAAGLGLSALIRMPDWTEFTSPGASGAYAGRYSGPYFTGRYWPGGKRIMRVDAMLDGYKPSNTATVIHEGVTPVIPGIAQLNIVNIGGSIRVQDTEKQPYHMPLNTAGVSSALPGNFRVLVAYNAFQLYSVNCGLVGESYQVIMWAEWFEN
jgi:hypothetical protein